MEFLLNRSNRKTLSVSLTGEGRVIVKAPVKMTDKKIHLFLQKNKEKIILMQKKQTQKTVLSFDMVEKDFDRFNAIQKIKQRFILIKNKAEALGLKISGSPQFKLLRSRWGSCHVSGTITFNILLGLLPECLIDAVIAHEFCHLKEMNHSQKFYDILLKLYPNYKDCDVMLKKFHIKRQEKTEELLKKTL